MTFFGPISLHGGYSGEFCCHAHDRLADIIAQAYVNGTLKAAQKAGTVTGLIRGLDRRIL